MENNIYAPFGGITGMDYNNGIKYTAAYDTRYRLSRITAGDVLNLQYQYDLSSNIDTISDTLSPEKSQTFEYDKLNRLAHATGGYGSIEYTHDPVGNRETKTANDRLDTYTTLAGTNRLQKVTGALNKEYLYDKTGNITKSNSTHHVYNGANQLIQLIENNSLLAEYVYNGKGQRVKKTVGDEVSIYHYDILGNMIAVTDSSGNTKEKYLYINNERIARIEVTYEPLSVGDVDQNGRVEPADGLLVEQYLVGIVQLTEAQKLQADVSLDGQVAAPDAMFIKQIANGLRQLPNGEPSEVIYYYHNNHLGTPVALTNQEGAQVWRADYLPFGEVFLQEGSVEQPFRFPGQIYDAETGLNYNWHRYYEPGIGRYITADPIGLAGGMNLYSYVGGNPINGVDFKGLDWGQDGSLIIIDDPSASCGKCHGTWESGYGIPNSFGRSASKYTICVFLPYGLTKIGLLTAEEAVVAGTIMFFADNDKLVNEMMDDIMDNGDCKDNCSDGTAK